jgi:hypothetical protein
MTNDLLTQLNDNKTKTYNIGRRYHYKDKYPQH